MVKISFNLFDNVSPMIKQMIVLYPNAVKTALNSVGWFLRNMIMSGIKTKNPGGSYYAEHADVTKSRNIDNVKRTLGDGKRVKVSTSFSTATGNKKVKGDLYKTKSGKDRRYTKRRQSKPPAMLGKLRSATRYKVFFNKSNLSGSNVKIGWLENKMKRGDLTLNQLGMIHEKGKKINVTSKMRRLWRIAGYALKKSVIDIPARPTIQPVFRRYKNQIIKVFENKLISRVINQKKKSFSKLLFKELVK